MKRRAKKQRIITQCERCQVICSENRVETCAQLEIAALLRDELYECEDFAPHYLDSVANK